MSLLTQVIGSAATILALTVVICLIIFIMMSWKQRGIWKKVPKNMEAVIKVENDKQKKSLERRILRLEKGVKKNEENIEEERNEQDTGSEITSDANSTDEDGEDFLDARTTEREDLFSGKSDEDDEYDEFQGGSAGVTEPSSDRTGQDEGWNKSSGFTPI